MFILCQLLREWTSMHVQNAIFRVIHLMQQQMTGTSTMLTPEGRQKLVNLIIAEENYRQFPYTDTRGHLTIGYGHNLEARGITIPIAKIVLNEDIDYFLDKIHEHIKYFPYLSETRKIALMSMVYNLGVKGFLEFTNMHLALEGRNWDKAAKEIENSKAYQQVPNRYERIAYMIRNDEFVMGELHGAA